MRHSIARPKRPAKKYASLKHDLAGLATSLKARPDMGTAPGHGCYKVRLSIASKGKGRSGGGRVITHVILRSGVVYLMTIYDKSERSTITVGELKEILSQIPE